MVARRGRRLNQGDIAERLGVSISTVSRALANEGGISPGVREDVRQLAQTMGYRSKRIAGVGQLDQRVAAFVPLGGATSGLSGFYFGIVEGMRSATSQAGIALDVRLIDENAVSLASIKRQVEEGASGLLLAGLDATDELADWCTADSIPVVLVNGSDPRMRMSSVSPANFYGAYEATRRLLDAGHRSIIHFTQRARPTILQRQRGFEAAVADVPGARGVVINSHEVSRQEFVARLIGGAYDATALFLWNDIVAVQVLEALSAAGDRRFSLIGFDDLPIASLATPRLSTVHVDREAIGRAAIKLLRDQIAGDRSLQQLEIGVTQVAGLTVAGPGITSTGGLA